MGRRTRTLLGAGALALLGAGCSTADGVHEPNPLRGAIVALEDGDDARYDELVEDARAVDGGLPALVDEALARRDGDLIERAAEMLESTDAELYGLATDAVVAEQSLLPERGPVPDGSSPVPTEVRAMIEADRWGETLSQYIDRRGLEIPDAVRYVLSFNHAPGAELPRPVDFEAARRELRDLIEASEPAAATSTSTMPPPIYLLLAVGGAGVVVAVVLLRGRTHRRLAELAMTDGLTGLMNRRRLDEDLRRHSGPGKTATALLMVDVDNFKAFNDEYGHTTGDEVLRRVAAAISASIRAGDIAYRYGGEEFCVFLPDTADGEALSIADRIRIAVADIELPVRARVTASVGVAGARSRDVTETLNEADRALRGAKALGRNRVVLAGPERLISTLD